MTGARFVVQGRVQGVGFRWFVSREARRLKLVGWARNLSDGSVEVVAAGEETAIASLEQALNRGPSMSHVTGVEKEELPHDHGLPNSFDIS